MEVVDFTIAIVCVLNSGLLLLGTAAKNENILRPWLCLSFVILLTVLCDAIFHLYTADFPLFAISATELLVNGFIYSCVFFNLDELTNAFSDDEGEDEEYGGGGSGGSREGDDNDTDFGEDEVAEEPSAVEVVAKQSTGNK